MTESQYTQSVHRKLPPTVFKWKVRDDYQGGVPDAYYRRDDGKPGPTLWVEYKYLKNLPKRSNTVIKPGLTEQQKQWLAFAQRAGDKVAVVVGHGSKGVWLSLDEALEGITVAEFTPRLENYDVVGKRVTDIVTGNSE